MAEVVENLDFGGLAIAFDSRILRPRPWTLAQSQWAEELMRTAPAGRALELCCGAGHIGLASVRDNERSLVCVDLDVTAVEYCLANAHAAGIEHRVEVRFGDLDAVLVAGEEFAVVIADPPWVRADATGTFPEDPLLAIDGGPDGLDVARSCLEAVEQHLAASGSCVIQLGTEPQADDLARWAHDRGRLRLVEQRGFGERGVLAQFDRVS